MHFPKVCLSQAILCCAVASDVHLNASARNRNTLLLLNAKRGEHSDVSCALGVLEAPGF